MTAIISFDLSTTIAFSIRSLSLGLLLAGWTSLSSLAQTPASNNRNENRLDIVAHSFPQNDQVAFSIKVTTPEGKTIEGLNPSEQLSLTIDGNSIPPRYLIFPKQTETPPARIVILLDYSGSMTDEDRGRKTSKLDGAIKAIRMFSERIAAKGNTDIKISIVPFGKSTDSCRDKGDEINNNLLSADNPNSEQLLGNFVKANSSSLDNKLETLKQNPPCEDTPTNLYESVAQALEFLGNPNNRDFNPSPDSQQQKPRLIVILLSDGFNTIGFDPQYKNDICAPEHFQKLQNDYLQSETYSEVRVFTLGYGLTPEQLRKNTKSYKQINCRTVVNDNRLKRQFVDQSALREIALQKKGTPAFSGNETGVINAFDDFRKTILGEYKVIYTNPRLDRGTKHQVTAKVNFLNGSIATSESPYEFSIPLVRFVQPSKRLISLFMIGLLGVLAVIPFFMWANNLKRRR